MSDMVYEGGKRVDVWRVEPWRVFGGFRIMRCRWVRDPRYGWDQERAPTRDCSIYRTENDALAAVARLESVP